MRPASAEGAAGIETRLEMLEVDGRQVLVAFAGTGPAVVYLHGLCDIHSLAPPERLTPFLSGLAERCRVVCPSLPGYPGSSPLGRFHDVEDYAFHLSDVIEALALADSAPAVVGHSLGGWLAAELALRRPELVSRLVLLAPLGLHVQGADIPPVFGALAPRGLGGLDEPRRLLFGTADGTVAIDALPDTMSDDQQRRWFGGLAGAAALGWKAPHFQSRRLAARLSRIGVPTLLACGGRDRLVPDQLCRAWADSLPQAELLEVPGAGHALVLEHPELSRDVAAFVERQ
jgi:pimeloyl-ACP methyl ester carboxylesterase